MTAQLLTHFKQKITALKLTPSSGGCFELSLDGELIYSKLKTGEFPQESAIVVEVERRL